MNRAIKLPAQEPPKTCTRTSHCSQQECMICCTPTNHVCNLDAAMNNSDGPPTSPISLTTAELPPPPPNHLILRLTATFKDAIIKDLINLHRLHDQTMSTNLEFLFYDLTDLHTACTTTTQLINSFSAASTPLPDSPANRLLHVQPTSPPPASFKPPKLVTETCSGQS